MTLILPPTLPWSRMMARLPAQQAAEARAHHSTIPGASSDSGSVGSSTRMVQERGSLRTLSDGKSQFIGSASGVYFVNTVRRAFSDANSRSSSLFPHDSHLSPEDCILGHDEEESQTSPAGGGNKVHISASQTLPSLSYGRGIPLELGRPPPADVARNLFMCYFRTWHQFFPFLHGPTLLKDLEQLYSVIDRQPPDQNRASPLPPAKVLILQCLFNLASLHDDEELPVTSQIDKPGDILSFLPSLAVKSDVVSIQALFAAQLLFVARMLLRTAAAVGGFLVRSIFLAGLHRCPVRYREFSTEDCDVRKRLFWSIFVIDRYLSQALGHPLGIQDSDVDVCSLAGPELHIHHHQLSPPVTIDGSSRNQFLEERQSPKNGDPVVQTDQDASITSGRVSDSLTREDPPPRQELFNKKQYRHLILSSQADYSRLLGRALELFHKSIHVRSMDPHSVLSLRTDVNAWWNALPSHLQEVDSFVETSVSAAAATTTNRSGEFCASAFFNLIHSQLVLLIHRPWLSLEPSCPEFHSALQICIGVARSIVGTLKIQHNGEYALFWPGYLSALWMAGLILAFACHFDLYPAEKGQREINLCLEVLSAMSSRWPLARNCHTVLSDLQQTFGGNKDAAEDLFTLPRNPLFASTDRAQPLEGDPDYELPSSKKRRLDADVHPRQTTGDHALGREPVLKQNIDGLGQSINQGRPSVLDVSYPGPSSSEVRHGAEGLTQTGILGGNRSHAVPSHERSQHLATVSPFRGGADDPLFGPIPASGHPETSEQIPTSNFDFDSTWMTGSSVFGNWDAGMPDVFAGATWESLLNVINHDSLSWDNISR